MLKAEGPTLERLESIATLYQLTGDLRGAAAYLHMAEEREDATDQTVLKLVSIYLSAGKNEEAVGIMEKALARFPDSSGINYTLGVLYANSGQPESAIEKLQHAAALDPENAELSYVLAQVYLHNEQKENASDILKKLSRGDSFPVSWDLVYCQVLMDLEKGNMAVRRLNKLQEKEPDNATVKKALLEALFKNSMIEINAGRLSRAQKSLERALELDPDKVETLMGLAVLYKQMGDPLNALKYCDYALARDHENLKLFEFKGGIERAEGMTKEADSTYKKGLQIARTTGDEVYIQKFTEKIENPL